MNHKLRMTSLGLLLTITLLVGCQKNAIVEDADYNRPLPPGVDALRRVIDLQDWPDVSAAFVQFDPDFNDAMQRSLAWFDLPSTKKHFPVCSITHAHANVSMYALIQTFKEAKDRDDFKKLMQERFACYTSVGWNMNGIVLFTGYYTPIFKGSQTRTSQFQFPLYKRPADLVTDPITGKPQGRKINGQISPYPTRQVIEESGMLKGTELVYLKSKFDAYLIHVQGSAKIELPDNSAMYVGYAGKTDRPYVGLGRTMVDEGLIPEKGLSLQAIRDHFATHPGQLDQYLNKNESYVFFREYDGTSWPAGSLGFKAAPLRTLATDKEIFPRGGLVFVDTQVGPGYDRRPFSQFMLDQDTGGAIRSAGRADIYMGIGKLAELQAGNQYAEGQLFYFFLKPDHYLQWYRKFKEEK